MFKLYYCTLSKGEKIGKKHNFLKHSSLNISCFRIDKLDLGENFLSSLPVNMFNGTLAVTDLNLDYNYIGENNIADFCSNALVDFLGHLFIFAFEINLKNLF